MTHGALYNKLQDAIKYEKASTKKQNSNILRVNGVEYVGVKIEHFERQQPFNIGRGGFSNVKCYKHTRSDTIMAVKELRHPSSQDDTHKNPITRDILNLTTVQGNDHIVTLYGSFNTTGDTYICMDKMETCFAKILDNIGKKEIPTKVIAMMCYSVSDALCYLKQKNIIHRDIKPANILLSAEGVIKLSDFGGSGLLHDSVCLSDPSITTQYAAPERISTENAGVSCVSDVWSLGISAFELATKENPYTSMASKAYEILDMIVKKEPPILSTSHPGYHSKLADFISYCLKRNPRHRMYPKPNKPRQMYIMSHSFIEPRNLAGTEYVKKWYYENCA